MGFYNHCQAEQVVEVPMECSALSTYQHSLAACATCPTYFVHTSSVFLLWSGFVHSLVPMMMMMLLFRAATHHKHELWKIDVRVAVATECCHEGDDLLRICGHVVLIASRVKDSIHLGLGDLAVAILVEHTESRPDVAFSEELYVEGGCQKLGELNGTTA